MEDLFVTKRPKQEIILDELKKQCRLFNGPVEKVHLRNIILQANSQISESDFDALISKLLQEGKIYEPQPGTIKHMEDY